MDRDQRRGVEIVDHEVAIRHRVEAVGGRPVEPQFDRHPVAIKIEPGPGQGRTSERRFIHPDARIDEAAAVPAKHRDIGHQMMTERHRLARLEVGEARHDGGGMLLGAIQQRSLQCVDPGQRAVDRATHEQFEIRRHLIVARPRGVKLARDRPDQFGQALFDVHMDILERGILDQLARSIFRRDRIEPGQNQRGVIGSQNSLPPEHCGMRL